MNKFGVVKDKLWWMECSNFDFWLVPRKKSRRVRTLTLRGGVRWVYGGSSLTYFDHRTCPTVHGNYHRTLYGGQSLGLLFSHRTQYATLLSSSILWYEEPKNFTGFWGVVHETSTSQPSTSLRNLNMLFEPSSLAKRISIPWSHKLKYFLATLRIFPWLRLTTIPPAHAYTHRTMYGGNFRVRWDFVRWICTVFSI